ncbi:hypothetical protein MRB53_005100 [Persea americana]|uniref:Uncharacterized protein n=1 Tax=Persea americana TaxID=3435 RepID=A0ACC2MDV6_PERAE|nr:hypothetical protein MRB53_005100 [Persea americana]
MAVRSFDEEVENEREKLKTEKVLSRLLPGSFSTASAIPWQARAYVHFFYGGLSRVLPNTSCLAFENVAWNKK